MEKFILISIIIGGGAIFGVTLDCITGYQHTLGIANIIHIIFLMLNGMVLGWAIDIY